MGESREILVVMNPGSGSSTPEYQEEIEAGLAASGVAFSIAFTHPEVPSEKLVQEAAARGVKHIMACGGDGTVMAVINGICKSGAEVTLSIVPGGTANLVATALELPSDVQGAVAVAVAGATREIDVGLCEGHYFALGVGVGLTERLVSQASAEWKERIGRWAYAAAMLRELGARPHRFMVGLDDAPDAPMYGVAVVVANAGEIGGGMHFAPDAKLDDGWLDLCILHRFNARDAFRLLANALRGRLHADRAVTFLKARKIRLSINPPLDVQIDGESLALKTPLVAEVVPKGLKVRVPDRPQQNDQYQEEDANR